jgi:methionine-S-sulfoxide reductase
MRLTIFLVIAILFLSSVAYADDASNPPVLEKATFAGGCFWCMQPFFDKTKGVKETSVGYTGGQTRNPTYEEVSSGTTGHAEGIQIVYDPQEVSYEHLLNIFWRNIDPTAKDGQFFDKGTQYRTAIFYHSEEQKRLAEKTRNDLAASGKFKKPIVTEIVAAAEFYPAEEDHQKYYKKNALRYKAYSLGSGREGFFQKIWGKENN